MMNGGEIRKFLTCIKVLNEYARQKAIDVIEGGTVVVMINLPEGKLGSP